LQGVVYWADLECPVVDLSWCPRWGGPCNWKSRASKESP